jgi:hypothetical protein
MGFIKKGPFVHSENPTRKRPSTEASTSESGGLETQELGRDGSDRVEFTLRLNAEPQCSLDPNALSLFDEQHSEEEERWITLGLDQTRAFLVISHTYHEEVNGTRLGSDPRQLIDLTIQDSKKASFRRLEGQF